MPKRIRDLTALTPATGDFVAIDRPGGATGRATIAIDPTPNTLVLRNAQGAVQDGVEFDQRSVLQVNGGYVWTLANAWVPLVTWTAPNWFNRGVSADLHIVRAGHANIGAVARLRVRAQLDSNGAPTDARISVANDIGTLIINAALVQVDANTIQLWAQFQHAHLYVGGTAGGNTSVSVAITEYGNIGSQAQTSPPSPISGGLYLEWTDAVVGQTFPGPGYIVSASRGVNAGYIRYDNGTQVCWATITVGSGSWTYPAAFASTPQVQATAQDTAPRLATITSVSTTAAGVLRTDLSGTTQSGTVHLWAIGLWK